MKLQAFKRIFLEDYTSDQQSLVQKLALILNPDIEAVYIALANRLDFINNFDATVKTIQVTVDANGKPTTNTTIPLNVINNTTPSATGSIVTRAQNQTNTTIYPSGAVQLSFTQTRELVTITNITGLQANNAYSLNVIFLHS